MRVPEDGTAKQRAESVQTVRIKSNEEVENLLTEEDALRKYKTSNPKLTKALKMFADAFKNQIKDALVGKLYQLSYEISKTIHEMHPGEFPKVVRSKLHNLRENGRLCSDIYSGKVTPVEFIRMSSDEMKSEKLKNKDDELLKDSFMAAFVAEDVAETEMFTCSRCKQNKCKYTQLQTRSSDEPMTTFVRCTVCGHRWRC